MSGDLIAGGNGGYLADFEKSITRDERNKKMTWPVVWRLFHKNIITYLLILTIATLLLTTVDLWCTATDVVV